MDFELSPKCKMVYVLELVEFLTRKNVLISC